MLFPLLLTLVTAAAPPALRVAHPQLPDHVFEVSPQTCNDPEGCLIKIEYRSPKRTLGVVLDWLKITAPASVVPFGARPAESEINLPIAKEALFTGGVTTVARPVLLAANVPGLLIDQWGKGQ